MDVQRYFAASQLGSAAKGNLPPKRIVSAGSLFKQQKELRKANASKHGHSRILAPKSTKIMKTLQTKHSSHLHAPKSRRVESNPVYRSFAETIKNCRHATVAVRGKQLEPVYEELSARVDGLTVHSKPIQTSGIPSNAELNAVLEKDATLFKPLDDEQMTIQNQRKNGTVELKNVRLGDTMLTFERQVNAKRGELEELMQQLKAVDTEIAAAHKAVLDAEQNAVRKAKAVFVAELASLEKEAGAVAGRTRAEVKKARKEDQTEKAGMDRKLEEFMRELL